MVNVRDTFVNERGETALVQKRQRRLKDYQHFRVLHLFIGDEAAVSKAGMTREQAVAHVGRKEGGDPTIVIPDYKRMILEAVTVIIHVIPKEKKGAVLTL